jgi:uncharacterized protein YbjQ (UPF0145 family)
MSNSKPIGVAYLDQNIEGGEIGRENPQLVRGTQVFATDELGYCSCAFGEVTQLTNKTTEVTLNQPSGRITMNGAALGANTVVSFKLNNSTIGPNDAVVANISNGGTLGAYILYVAEIGVGFADFSLFNVSGGTLSEAVKINYAVIRNRAE